MSAVGLTFNNKTTGMRRLVLFIAMAIFIQLTGFSQFGEPYLPDVSFSTLSNMNSQQLLSRTITGQKVVVDISGLPKGIYFIKVADDRKIMVGKLLNR
jgi:hypothetical protein